MRFPIRLLPHKLSIDFMKTRWIGFGISGLIIVATFISLAVQGLNLGIDFEGGILMEIRTVEKPADLEVLRGTLSKLDLGEASLQNFGGDHEVVIRVQDKSGEDHAAVVEHIKQALNAAVDDTIEYRRVDYVGPQAGETLVRNGVLAVVLSLIGMTAYIGARFKWQHGVGAVVALLHDAIAVIGFLSFSQLEFSLTSIAAVLTVLGYSVNDSVVIYDRIRENSLKYRTRPLGEVINISLNETLARTILTGLTVLLSLAALIMFGGEVLRSFSWAMFFGVIVGTYSSIYISAAILIYLHLDVHELAVEQKKA